MCKGVVGFVLSAVQCMLFRLFFFLNQILLNKFLAEDEDTGDALGLPHFNSL